MTFQLRFFRLPLSVVFDEVKLAFFLSPGGLVEFGLKFLSFEGGETSLVKGDGESLGLSVEGE